MNQTEFLEVIAEAARTKAWDLNLSNKGLFSLPAQIGQLTHLRRLSLMGNPLTSVPAEIGLLVNLQTLSVAVDQLASLPPEIYQLTHLTTLYILTFRLNARVQNVHHGRFEIRFSTSNEMLWIYGDLGIACLLYQSVINS